jgi:hypothetical protein
MRYQLRDYRITAGAMDRWVAEWREQVVPLRTAAGFTVVGAWANPETDRFVWILAHDGDFEEEDRAYYASSARAAVSPDPARLIEDGNSEFVVPVL